MSSASVIRLVSWLLMGSALSLVIYSGSNAAYDLSSQSELANQWDQAHKGQAQAPAATPGGNADFGSIFQIQRPRLAVGQPLAKISVPAAGNWKGIVLEGSDSRVLSGGPGHVVGSAYPGEPDNVVISNHNTYSLQFANIKAGDQIILDTDYGHFVYRINGTHVVSATDRSITGHTGKPMLTFTTCWPLWLGALATQRLAITADLVQA